MKAKKNKQGFSLLELSLVLIISGVTLMALLQMLDLSFIHYKFIDEGFKEAIIMSNARIWLRNQITEKPLSPDGIPPINDKELIKALALKDNYVVKEFKLTQHKNKGFFVHLALCHHKNKNQEPGKDGSFSQLFYFRSRS
jgi:prepilin-type N-terminal cleavage/methylation domain-containing protein